jgi:hypothetical protein
MTSHTHNAFALPLGVRNDKSISNDATANTGSDEEDSVADVDIVEIARSTWRACPTEQNLASSIPGERLLDRSGQADS